MENFAIEGIQPVQIAVLVVFGGLTILLVRLLASDPEVAVNYSVPAPEQCSPDWKGEVLKSPSLKAGSAEFSVINC